MGHADVGRLGLVQGLGVLLAQVREGLGGALHFGVDDLGGRVHWLDASGRIL